MNRLILLFLLFVCAGRLWGEVTQTNKEQLEEVLAAADRMVLLVADWESWKSCEAPERKVVFDIEEAGIGLSFCDVVEFVPDGGGICLCISEDRIVFFEGDEELLSIMPVASELLDWRGGDGKLTDGSSLEFGTWFAERGSGYWIEGKQLIEGFREAARSRVRTFYGSFPTQLRKRLLIDGWGEERWTHEKADRFTRNRDKRKYGRFLRFWDSEEDSLAELCKAAGRVDAEWDLLDDVYDFCSRVWFKVDGEALDWAKVFEKCRDDSDAMLGLAALYFEVFRWGREVGIGEGEGEVAFEIAQSYFARSEHLSSNGWTFLKRIENLDAGRAGSFMSSLLEDWLKEGKCPVGVEGSGLIADMALRFGEGQVVEALAVIERYWEREIDADERLMLELAMGLLGRPVVLRAEHFASRDYSVERAVGSLLERFPSVERFDVFVRSIRELDADAMALGIVDCVRAQEAFTGEVFLEEKQYSLKSGNAEEIVRWWGGNRERFL